MPGSNPRLVRLEFEALTMELYGSFPREKDRETEIETKRQRQGRRERQTENETETGGHR